MSLDPAPKRAPHSLTHCAAGEPQGTPLTPEEESARGEGHGISRNRAPADERGLPREGEREQKQPYAGELDDYSGGSASPPDEEARRDEKRPSVRWPGRLASLSRGAHTRKVV